MRRIIFVSMTAVMISLLTGCGGSDTHDKVASDMAANLKSIVGVLESVTDKSSAENQSVKLRALAANMDAIQTRLNTLGKPSKEVGDQLNSKYAAEMTQLQKEMAIQRDRLAKLGPEVIGPIDAAMRSALKGSSTTTRPN